MDVESLSNHIRRLGKSDFDRICRLILSNYYNKIPINVDGNSDGGTDFIETDSLGKRKRVAYQLTVQKTDLDKKFFRDAKKAVDKLKVSKFYFLTSNSISETTAREWEEQIENELGISCSCFGCRVIADMLIQSGLANEALSEMAARIPRDLNLDRVEIRERTLHAYTLLSSDAKNLREGIYDDTILMTIGTSDKELNKDEIVESVKDKLSLTDNRDDVLYNRLNSLFSKGKIRIEKETEIVTLTSESEKDINCRKQLYDADLASMVSAQTDLMNENKIDWNVADSRKVSLWLANFFICQQMAVLKETKSELVLHPLLGLSDKGDSLLNVTNYLRKEKNATIEIANNITNELQKIAASDPLIQKITRASMYLALEGNSPMARSKALGAKNWEEFDLLIDASVALHCICHALYNKYDYGRASDAIRAIHRAQELSIQPKITYFYIKECAGHLLESLNYININLSDNEMQYSSNVFVSHYYGMKLNGRRVPDTLEDFLYSFSAQLKSKFIDRKAHIRALMTDIQKWLRNEGILFEGSQMLETEECDVYRQYLDIVNRMEPDKRSFLVDHDTWALQHIIDTTNKENAHWVFLTYDRTLRQYGKETNACVWISKPSIFLDLVESTQELSESDMQEMVHLIATSSESTLSLGARMMDKIIEYAGADMQNVEFQEDFHKYKNDSLSAVDYKDVKESAKANALVEELVNKYLKSKGIERSVYDITDDEEDSGKAEA